MPSETAGDTAGPHGVPAVPANWLRLCDLVASGEADAVQRAAFERRLSQSPELASAYLDYACLLVDLGHAASRSPASELATLVVETSQNQTGVVARAAGGGMDAPKAKAGRARAGLLPRLSPRIAWPAVASLAAALVLWATLFARPNAAPINRYAPTAALGTPSLEAPRSAEPPLATSVAIVGHSKDVTWAKDAAMWESRSLLKPGDWVCVESGAVEIEFSDGAVTLLQGPVRFRPTGPNAAELEFGRVAAVVPPWADGFRIDTPRMRVIDRGTQFAVAVDELQNVDVTVTHGEVEVARTQADRTVSDTRRVVAGDSIRADAEGVRPTNAPARLVRLTRRLPIKPDGSQLEVVGRYTGDFVPGVPDEPARGTGWRYLTNTHGPIGDPANYAELLWDPFGDGCFDVDGSEPKSGRGPLALVKLRHNSGHPGQGGQQSRDGFDRFAIAAFVIPSDGDYSVESGWIVRPENKPWLANQAVEVLIHANGSAPVLRMDCERNENSRFRADLGRLREGQAIYIAVGPRGNNYNDRFEWGFVIAKELEHP
ncbi:MAG: FecR family protein [Planctomycetota bacterium]